MTAYVVSGLGQAEDAGYKIDDQPLSTKAAPGLISTLAAHPDMIPDLRAYVGLCAGHHRRRAQGRARQGLGQPRQAERRRAGAGRLGSRCSRRQPRAQDAATLLEKKAKVTDTDAYWEGNYDGLLEYWDDTSAGDDGLCAQAAGPAGSRERLCCPRRRSGLAEHRDGDYWYSTKQTAMVIQGLTDYLALSGELANTSDVEVLVNGASVGKRHFGPGDGFALPWQNQGSRGASRQAAAR